MTLIGCGGYDVVTVRRSPQGIAIALRLSHGQGWPGLLESLSRVRVRHPRPCEGSPTRGPIALGLKIAAMHGRDV